MSAVPMGRPAARPRPRTRWPFAVAFGAIGSLIVGLVVLAFVWPAATAVPRDLPVGVAGPATEVSAFEKAVAAQATDPFRFEPIGSRADAERRIRDRTLDGAVLLGPEAEVLTSSAASAVSNQAMRGVAAGLQQQVAASVERALVARLQAAATGGSAASAAGDGVLLPTVRLTDVVALSSTDGSGAGLAAASFPIVLGGMLGGVLVSLLVVGPARRIVALTVYGVVAGAVVALVLQTWLHVLQRDWLTNAAAFGLSMVATSAFVVGCNSLFGPRGIAIGSVVSVLVGNPISGAAIPSQFIAGPWGVIGQYFVPGAASTLIRSLSYFPDADTGRQWLVLGAWAVGGLLLTVIGHFRSRAPIPLPAAELEPAGAIRGATA